MNELTPHQHDQVSIVNPLTEEKFAVDTPLAPILQELWALGFDTYMCCECWRKNKKRWVVMKDPWDAIFVARWFNQVLESTEAWLELAMTNAEGNASSLTSICWHPKEYRDEDVLWGLRYLREVVENARVFRASLYDTE